MTNESENSKRLAKNTLILYARMLFTVGISFYTTRLILANLGVDNYGIYNVIGGFVAMFYMVTSTMTQAVGRFLTFDLGKGDISKLQKTFSTSVNILLLMSIFVVILAETIGLWFINSKLNIADERMLAANWIYQFSVFAFVLEMISVPYSASVISHEKMGTFAFVTIVKVLLTLGIAFALSISPIDRLVFYGLLVFLVDLLIQLMYWFYCRNHFEECCYSPKIEKGLFKEMFSFAGWNFFTTSAAMLSSQGVNIILNMHFGTAINAARGIAGQINGTTGAFFSNFEKALHPQLTKSYASGDYNYTKSLVCRGAKMTYLLLFFVALPCMLEIDFFLDKWITEVPPYASVFVQLTLLNNLVEVILHTNMTLNSATGKIRNYQLLLSVGYLLVFIGSYLVLIFSDSPVLAIAVTNIVNIFLIFPRLYITKHILGITVGYFFKNVILRLLVMSVLSASVCLLFMHYVEDGWFRFFSICVLSTSLIAFFSYLIVLTSDERKVIIAWVTKKVKGFRE